MSTNKTPNYNLHSWLPQDEFHVSEINENFAKLDAAVKIEATAAAQKAAALETALAARPTVVIGVYTGDNAATRNFDLGGKPIAVMLEGPGGYRQTDYYVYGGFFTQELSLKGEAAITDTGFRVLGGDIPHYLNRADRTYTYMAFFL